ncbi:MAG: TIGR01777 family protein [Bacteroidetes bacterium]|nr:TIGR01777 family protein [Bacteroidota bacterium]
MRKLIIAGGTGFLGQALCNHFKRDYDTIIILSRSENKTQGNIVYLQWDGKTLGGWCAELENATAIINLSGKSINCRFTDNNKKYILSSRINSTKIIGEAILKCKNPPEVWINGSSAAIYPNSETEAMSEFAAQNANGFMAEVTRAWEKAATDFILPQTRQLFLRTTLVYGLQGGVLPVLVNLVKKGLGGTMGKGSQKISWIHVNDFCSIIEWMLANKNAMGAYNMAAPEPVTNKKLMHLLRKKMGISIGLPAPELLIKIGAFFIRSEPELILDSRNVIPQRLIKKGFTFKYKLIEECIGALI